LKQPGAYLLDSLSSLCQWYQFVRPNHTLSVKTNRCSVSCKCGRYDRSKSAECRTKS